MSIYEVHCVPPGVKTLVDAVLPENRLPLQVGLSMYIEGREEWWLTTPIVSIEEEDEK